ncbi:MAG: hypothetical protein V8S82_03605 [Eubacteriales bacterium]
MEKNKKLMKPRKNFDPRVKLYGDELGGRGYVCFGEGCYLIANSCSPGDTYVPIPVPKP